MIAGVMGTTLLLAWSGETFMLSAAPIWVRPVAVALSVAQGRSLMSDTIEQRSPAPKRGYCGLAGRPEVVEP